MAALRNTAKLCGPCPFFTWHLSSPNETSRTQCRRFSMPQWPRQWAKQKRRVGPLARKTADGVLDFDRGATLAAGRAFQTADLRQTGPIEMPGQPRAGLQMPLHRAAVPLRRRAGLRQRRSSLVFGSGGKNRAENPLPPRLSVRADCP